MDNILGNPLNKLDIYSWMIVVLAIFSAAGIYTYGLEQTLPQTLIAVVAANAFDILAKYFKTKRFAFTKSATITGLFIGQLLPLSTEFYIPLVAALIAIASKHFINWKNRHIFNPTIFSMIAISLIFSIFPAWWGSFAFPIQQIPQLNLVAVILLGLIITFRQRRHDLVWPFLGVFVLISSIFNLSSNSSQLFYIPDSTILYALFFMLVEPKTSPLFSKARFVYGILAAVIFASLNFFSVENVPLYGIILANLFVLVLDKYFKGPLWQSSSKSQSYQTSAKENSS